jgi:MFS family permease
MTETTRNPWTILLVLSLGFFMILLDTTIVYVATPSILTSLHTSLDLALWVLNAYLLAYAVLLITAGRIGDIFGPRQLFVAGLVLFTSASALCGLSQDVNQLIAFRVLQGVGGALLTPQTLSIITNIFPPERRGAAFGVWGAVAGVSTVAGPTLGGLIVTNWDWRWILHERSAGCDHADRDLRLRSRPASGSQAPHGHRRRGPVQHRVVGCCLRID